MYQSKSISSNQSGVHSRLGYVVQRHVNSPYLKPFQLHNLRAFEMLLTAVERRQYSSLILDSCCGTGLSTIGLAESNPCSLVIGIDQSFARLNKERAGVEMPPNCLLLQANCEDIWRLCEHANIRFKAHYILYPNPYPKSEHLQRRWHGHPVFPVLKGLSDTVELRSNWKLYLDEFAVAWCFLTGSSFEAIELSAESVIKEPLTLFERKYSQSGQRLYQLQLQLST